MSGLPRNTILVGDAVEQLHRLPTHSIDCVITSPPYYALRDYGVDGQLGLEVDVGRWVTNLLRLADAVARVLKPTGSLWLNLGDSYSRHVRYGAPPKGMLLGPERLLLALAARGWICRNKVVWAKPNAMPSSVTDRLNTTSEVVYFLVRCRQYYFDLDAIREPHRSRGRRRPGIQLKAAPPWVGPLAAGTHNGLRRARPARQPGHPLGKNPGDVWTVATRGYRGAHFATFPEELVRRPLLATCPPFVCTACGHPSRSTARRACACDAAQAPGIVLDPFFGTGTVGLVARKHARDWIGIELNPAYVAMARERLHLDDRDIARAAA